MAEGPVTVEIEGIGRFEPSSVRYSFHRPLDNKGKPTYEVVIDAIYFKVKALKNDKEFVEWMVESYDRRSGKISYKSTDTFKKKKDLEFRNGVLKFYRETYEERAGFIIEFEISPQEIIVGTAILRSLSEEDF